MKKFASHLSVGKLKLSLMALLIGGLLFSCQPTGSNNDSSTKKEKKGGVISYEHSDLKLKDGEVESYGYSHNTQDTWEVVAGHTQSPIQIKSSDAVPMRDSGLIDMYKNISLKSVTDEKTTLFAEVASNTTINGRSFDLIQFHFHSPAEHVVDGITYDLELHFVHISQSGRLAVLGVLIKEGEFNPTFQVLLDALKDPSTAPATLDVTPLFPTNLNYFHYLGSLTTPPLTENVEWQVFAQPIEISAEQLAAYRAHEHYNNTARHTQPLNGRTLLNANAEGLK